MHGPAQAAPGPSMHGPAQAAPGPPVHGPRREGDWRRGALDAARAQAVLGWTPRTTLDRGLAQTMTYFRTEHGVKP